MPLSCREIGGSYTPTVRWLNTKNMALARDWRLERLHAEDATPGRQWLRLSRCIALLAALGAHCHGSVAADYSLLGFGTIGYAVSDMPAPYLRYIDKRGTFRADSLIGIQGEVQVDPQWGATLQLVGSAPRDKDNGFEASVRWAFVSYRPTNDWLIRVGRLRPPILNHTPNSEVGMTYDFARLPAEVYSLSPVYDIDGVAVTKLFTGDEHDVAIDFYAGKTHLKQKTPFQRDSRQTFVPDRYFPESLKFAGVVMSLPVGRGSSRVGIHRASIQPRDGRVFVEDPSPIDIMLPPPLGGVLFVPGAPLNGIGVVALSAGVEQSFGSWRYSAEFARRVARRTNMGPASTSGTLSVTYVAKELRPYFSLSFARPADSVRRYYELLSRTPVPSAVLGPPTNISSAYHQSLADAIYVYDQRSIALGASYRLNPNSMLKLEWMTTKVGLASALVDGDVRHRRFNVLSMSYNFTF